MKNSFQFAFAMTFIAAAAPAFAGSQWSKSISRGLDNYSFSNEGYSVSLVCDPERAFGNNSNATLLVQFVKHPSPAQIVVLAQSGEQAALKVDNGVVTEFKSDNAEWAKMVGIIAHGGAFGFVTSKDSFQLSDMDPIPELNCVAE